MQTMAFNPADPDEQPNLVPKDVVVSVRMSTYNHAPFIAQAIESVLMQQTNFPFELLIGEDDSTDGTRKICREYAERHPNKIRLFLRHEKDKVYVDGRKTGKYNGRKTREACRGEFVAVLEGDDFWLDPQKIQRQFECFQTNPDVGLCATRALVWNAGATHASYLNPPLGRHEVTLEDLYEANGGVVNTCTFMYRKEAAMLASDWSQHLLSGDWALMVAISTSGWRLGVLPSITAVYRVHDAGITRDYRKVDNRQAAHVLVLQSYCNNLEALLNADPFKHTVARRRLNYFIAARDFYKGGGLARITGLLSRLVTTPGVASGVFESVLIRAITKGIALMLAALPTSIRLKVELTLSKNG